jgi:cell division septation protein DedD
MLKSRSLASHSEDDGFHEIQLNGKQLVFLFMAATVVSVVIFLCGVLVGRGVKVERGVAPQTADGELPEINPPVRTSPPPAGPAGGDPTIAQPPPTAAEDFSYVGRLATRGQPSDDLKPATGLGTRNTPAPEKATSVPEKPAPVAEKPAPLPAANPKAPAAAPTSAAAPGQGYAVQVAALNVRSEADAIARRLTSKGYAAYVQSPSNGTPSVFRVRVGTFKTRREAESMAARLQKEEQFKPWITR